MLDFRFGRDALGMAAAAFALTACGGANTAMSGAVPLGTPLPAAPRGPSQPGWLSPEAKKHGKPVIYVADFKNNEVLIYPAYGKLQSPIGMISSGVAEPYGLWVDRLRTLYVANRGNHTVTVYPAGSTSPSVTYSQGLGDPLYPIVDRHGDLFVGNGKARPGGGTVVEYPTGSTIPKKVLRTRGNEADGMDFDQQGNLYVAYRNGNGSSSGNIEEFAPGSKRGQVLGMTLNQPQGVIVDDKRNILAVETGNADRIDLFAPGARGPLIEVPMPNGDTPTQLAISQKENRLFVTGYSGTVYVTHYPLHAKSSLSAKDDAQALIQGIASSNGQTF
jgi:sugar lactone lactonase YvrE